MVTKSIPVNHNILVWARKEANLSRESAANKACINDLKARGEKEGLSSTLRLERWEEGIETPSFSQLEKLAKAYRRPVLTFFLPEPPRKKTRLEDFRTIGGRDIDSDAFSPELSALLRQIEALQLNMYDLLLDIGSKPLSFVASVSPNTTPIQVAQHIRSLLDYSFYNQKDTGDYNQVFSNIRTKAGQQGVFVLLEGNLGSYHTNIAPEVFRGLAISDNIAPFIVINPNDAKPAMIFSLIHELSHILRGETGISNLNSLDISKRNLPYQNELFCDQVAAEFLVPESDLLREWEKLNINYSLEASIGLISRQFSVSRIVIARRLLDFGQIDDDFYWEFYETCQEEWRQIYKTKRTKEIKIPYKILTRSRLGGKLIDTVIGAAREGRISELDASRMLNVKINNFDKIV